MRKVWRQPNRVDGWNDPNVILETYRHQAARRPEELTPQVPVRRSDPLAAVAQVRGDHDGSIEGIEGIEAGEIQFGHGGIPLSNGDPTLHAAQRKAVHA
jgi:hypothetical protein